MSRLNSRYDPFDRIMARLRAQHSEPKPLRQVCAWCGALIRDGALTADGYESHGVCEPCRRQFFPAPGE